VEKTTGEKRPRGLVSGPNRENRMRVNVHTNPDIKVLWNITSDIDIGKDICSCVIDCEVVDNWYENLEKLKTFIDDNERRPKQKSSDKTEQMLGSWLSNQQQNYPKSINSMKSMKNPEKYNLWTAFLEEYTEYFKNSEEVWNEKLGQIKQFIDDNKHRPNQKSLDKIEKQFAQWISDQFRTRSTLESSKLNAWNEFLAEYNEHFKSNEEVWNETLSKLKMFINENKRRPSKHSSDEIEKRVCVWLSNNQKRFKTQKHILEYPSRYALLTEFLEEYQEYFQIIEEGWNEHFEQVKKFINQNKRKPSLTYENEKRLRLWISTQNANYKKRKHAMKDLEKYNLWTVFLEEYKEYFKSDDDIWNETFEKVKTFINNTKLRPNADSSNGTEKRLDRWISTQNANYKKRKQAMKDPEKYNKWTVFLEEYKGHFKNDDDIWNETFDKVKMFLNNNHHRPSSNSSNDIESRLGQWLAVQLVNYKTKSKSMVYKYRYDLWTIFLKDYAQYFKSNDEVWYETFSELKLFIDTHHMLPSFSNESEKHLSGWISNQKNNYKHKNDSMKDLAKYNLWTAFLEEYKGYFKNNEEVWNKTFEEVQTFIHQNEKRPSDKSKNNNETRLGRWISTQNTNYKKREQAMKDPEKYKLWTEFLEEYKNYMCRATPKKKSMKLNISSLSTEPKESTDQKRQRTESVLSELLRKYKTLTPDHLNTLFRENANLWNEFHAISEENESTFPEEDIPRNRIIRALDQIKTKRTKLVVDMGCGKAQIAKYFHGDSRFKFINYDHVASNDTVISWDISKMPLEDNSVEICIMSLAMWGPRTYCKQYLQEAKRILESDGKLYIIEPTNRWTTKDENGIQPVGPAGDKLMALLKDAGFKIIDQNIDKFCMAVCN
jgi:hypothetical protein